MTEDKLQSLQDDLRKIHNLESWLITSDKCKNPKAKLDALFEVNGWISEETLRKCYDLVRPELDEALRRLEQRFKEA